jgi:hypothetical protein
MKLKQKLTPWSRNRKILKPDLHGKVLIQPDTTGSGYARTWICPGIHPDLDPFRFASVRIRFRPERSGSTRTGSAQIWIRTDLIPTRAVWIRTHLDPTGSYYDQSGSGSASTRSRFRTEQIWSNLNGFAQIWIRSEADLDQYGSEIWIRPDLDLLLSCGKIFHVAKTICSIAAISFMSLITIRSCSKIFPVAKTIFALLRQDLSYRSNYLLYRYIFAHLLQDISSRPP